MKTFYLGFSLLVYNITFGQKAEQNIATAFKIFESDSQFKHAMISLYVVDTKSGKVVFDKNSQVGLAPASCLKVVTSAATFELLGKDYLYKTEFGYSGNLKDTSLRGNLGRSNFWKLEVGEYKGGNNSAKIAFGS
jgi:D-alanyl-D-alanine carboxypeptidase/D-alanyl-D-alanine-endopeptidase (penicillin-binding protein 4)